MADFDYELPEDAIAQEPVERRDHARLLVATDPAGAVQHRRVTDLPGLLGEGDVLVVNETRVLPARLRLRKPTGGAATVDLAVGIDTFRPVSVADADDHEMHSERYRVPAETMDACERARRVVAVGTTTVRALESAAIGPLEGRTSLFIRGDYPFR